MKPKRVNGNVFETYTDDFDPLTLNGIEIKFEKDYNSKSTFKYNKPPIKKIVISTEKIKQRDDKEKYVLKAGKAIPSKKKSSVKLRKQYSCKMNSISKSTRKSSDKRKGTQPTKSGSSNSKIKKEKHVNIRERSQKESIKNTKASSAIERSNNIEFSKKNITSYLDRTKRKIEKRELKEQKKTQEIKSIQNLKRRRPSLGAEREICTETHEHINFSKIEAKHICRSCELLNSSNFSCSLTSLGVDHSNANQTFQRQDSTNSMGRNCDSPNLVGEIESILRKGRFSYSTGDPFSPDHSNNQVKNSVSFASTVLIHLPVEPEECEKKKCASCGKMFFHKDFRRQTIPGYSASNKNATSHCAGKVIQRRNSHPAPSKKVLSIVEKHEKPRSIKSELLKFFRRRKSTTIANKSKTKAKLHMKKVHAAFALVGD